MSLVNIRSANLKDAKVLATLHQACFTPAWDEKSMVSLLNHRTIGLIASIAKKDVGFSLLRVAADEAEILSIAVLPATRQQGVGSKLLEASCHGAQKAGATSLFLDVAADNSVACHLYEHHGFVRIAKRSKYYANGADALTFQRSLG